LAPVVPPSLHPAHAIEVPIAASPISADATVHLVSVAVARVEVVGPRSAVHDVRTQAAFEPIDASAAPQDVITRESAPIELC
jgi:hypothetical protein